MAEVWIFILIGSFLLIGGLSAGSLFSQIVRTGNTPPAPQVVGQLVPVYFLLYLVFYHLMMRRQRRKLFVAFRALPPLEPGGPARCRLCGAPLPDRGIVRQCAYCGAESIVAERIMRRYRDSLSRFLRRAEKGLGKRLLRDMKKVEHAYSFSGFYFMAFVPVCIFGTAITLTVMNNRALQQRPAGQESTAEAVGHPSRLIVLFIMMAVLFLLWSLPKVYRGIQDYRRETARKIKEAEDEIE